MPLQVAIVGSGPAGYYTAAGLLKLGREVQIDVIDRLPTPYGLIRGGVAPDHQSTKNVQRNFERTALSDGVDFFGNVEVGRDVSVAELRDAYDAVVLAIGGALDRPSGIPGSDKTGVHGAAAFVGWYNGHPDFRDLSPLLDHTAAVVIGNGNVAIDVARVLVRPSEEMAASDLADHAAEAINASPLTDVHMCGRRGPIEAKFTNVELREMGHLGDCLLVVDDAQLPDAFGEMEDREKRLKEKNLATLAEFAERSPAGEGKRVHFQFFASPVEILGGDRVEGMRFERTRVEDGRAVGTGETFDIDCGLVVNAIGYRTEPLDGVPFDEGAGLVPNDGGRIETGFYVAGWAMRGPTGVISSNRGDGNAVAGIIDGDCSDGGRPGGEALASLLAERGVRRTDFADWQAIETAEVAAATAPAPRRKLCRIDDMLAVLDGDKQHSVG